MFTVSVEAATHKDMATQLAQLAAKFGEGVEIKRGKPGKEVEAEAELEVIDEGEAAATYPSDDEIIKAFGAYAKKQDKKLGEGKGRAKAIAKLKALGYAKPVDIPEEEREEVIDSLGV